MNQATVEKAGSETLPGIKVVRELLALGAADVPIKNSANAGGGVPFVVIPQETKVQSLEQYFPPQRIKQKVLLLEAGSFIAYVNRYQTKDTLIYADLRLDGASFLAVLDYHSAAPELTPRAIAHQVQFDTVKTPQFVAWLAANRKEMTQVDFATWLEDNAKLFTEPTGADLLEIVQTLFGKQDVRFNSAVRLQSGGNKLHYDEDVELSGTSQTRGGNIELPKEITATFQIFEGSAAYVVRARLKYRIASRKLKLWFETIALHEIVRNATLSLVQQIAAPVTPTVVGEEQLLPPGTGILPLLGKLM